MDSLIREMRYKRLEGKERVREAERELKASNEDLEAYDLEIRYLREERSRTRNLKWLLDQWVSQAVEPFRVVNGMFITKRYALQLFDLLGVKTWVEVGEDGTWRNSYLDFATAYDLSGEVRAEDCEVLFEEDESESGSEEEIEDEMEGDDGGEEMEEVSYCDDRLEGE